MCGNRRVAVRTSCVPVSIHMQGFGKELFTDAGKYVIHFGVSAPKAAEMATQTIEARSGTKVSAGACSRVRTCECRHETIPGTEACRYPYLNLWSPCPCRTAQGRTTQSVLWLCAFAVTGSAPCHTHGHGAYRRSSHSHHTGRPAGEDCRASVGISYTHTHTHCRCMLTPCVYAVSGHLSCVRACVCVHAGCCT